MTTSKLAEAKKVALDSIFRKGTEGIFESQVYCILYDYDKEHKIFEYGMDEINPSFIIEELIFKGMITRVSQNNLNECRIYLNEHFLSTLKELSF
jgi:hypothetical protein